MKIANYGFYHGIVSPITCSCPINSVVIKNHKGVDSIANQSCLKGVDELKIESGFTRNISYNSMQRSEPRKKISTTSYLIVMVVLIKSIPSQAKPVFRVKLGPSSVRGSHQQKDLFGVIFCASPSLLEDYCSHLQAFCCVTTVAKLSYDVGTIKMHVCNPDKKSWIRISQY